MNALGIVFRKELREILRDRRTLIAIGLAALATPAVLIVISQVTAQTATQTYTVGYSGDIPVGLDTLLSATGLKLERVADPAEVFEADGECDDRGGNERCHIEQEEVPISHPSGEEQF